MATRIVDYLFPVHAPRCRLPISNISSVPSPSDTITTREHDVVLFPYNDPQCILPPSSAYSTAQASRGEGNLIPLPPLPDASRPNIPTLAFLPTSVFCLPEDDPQENPAPSCRLPSPASYTYRRCQIVDVEHNPIQVSTRPRLR